MEGSSHIHSNVCLKSKNAYTYRRKFGISTQFFYNQSLTEGGSEGIIPYTYIMTYMYMYSEFAKVFKEHLHMLEKMLSFVEYESFHVYRVR